MSPVTLPFGKGSGHFDVYQAVKCVNATSVLKDAFLLSQPAAEFAGAACPARIRAPRAHTQFSDSTVILSKARRASMKNSECPQALERLCPGVALGPRSPTLSTVHGGDEEGRFTSPRLSSALISERGHPRPSCGGQVRGFCEAGPGLPSAGQSAQVGICRALGLRGLCPAVLPREQTDPHVP